MASKRPSLAESMRQAVQGEPEASASIEKPAAPKPVASPSVKPDDQARNFYAATRAGKKKVTASLDPAVHKQLKGLAVQRDTTTEALLTEAIEDLFRKHS